MLFLAIILEVCGTSSMKYFSLSGRWEGYAIMLFCIALSYISLSKAVIRIPISVAYAAWECIGLIGTTFIAWYMFNEDMSLWKLLAIAVIISGIVMIKLGTAKGEGHDDH